MKEIEKVDVEHLKEHIGSAIFAKITHWEQQQKEPPRKTGLERNEVQEILS